ncbi:MAG: hypothetical protein GF421_10875 [Candidatus Aminicenantes bacterium]|nr:hypothetical protein [Candidatus Aminicenantes bacterium]
MIDKILPILMVLFMVFQAGNPVLFAQKMDTNKVIYKNKIYPELTEKEMSELIQKISHIHTGEMVPYYVMQYGFYEGHTDFRADPISIAIIFGLKDLQEINVDLREYFLTGEKK